MEEKRYLISDAAKMVAVEAHVLRYWEEELELSIGRTELGHRYYTRENIETFCNIKELKEKGLQLKAIRVVLWQMQEKKAHQKERKEIEGIEKVEEVEERAERIEKIERAENTDESMEEETKEIHTDVLVMQKNAEKLNQFETLVAGIVDRVVKENNEDLQQRLESSFSKEIDYMIHMQEVREEERFRKLDALIRDRQKGDRMTAAAKEKGFFGRWFRK